MRKAVLIEKIERRNAISIYILIANSFILEHVFFIAKFPYAMPNFFATAIVLSLKYCLTESEIFLTKS